MCSSVHHHVAFVHAGTLSCWWSCCNHSVWFGLLSWYPRDCMCGSYHSSFLPILPLFVPALHPIVVFGAASLQLPSSCTYHSMLLATSIAFCWSPVVCYSVRMVRTRLACCRPGSTIVCACPSEYHEVPRLDCSVVVFSFCATSPRVQGGHSTRRFELHYRWSCCSIEKILGMQWNNWSFDVGSCKPWCPWNSLPNDR